MDVLELMLQNGALNLQHDRETVDFILGWYNGKGAFKDPKGSQSLISTAHALRSLRLLFSLQEADLEAVGDFLLECRRPDGGFSSSPGKEGSDIESTYYAVSCLHGLRRAFDTEATRVFVLSLLEGDGAFLDGSGGKKVRIYNTYFGIYSLSALGHEFQDIEREAALGYLSKQQNTDSGYRRSSMSKLSALASTAAALLVRYYFDPETDPGELDMYLSSLRHDSGGFLSFSGGVNPDMKSTYHALVCMGIMGIPADDAVREFIQSCRGPKGGYKASPEEPGPTLKDTYYGLASLCLL